MFHLPTSVNGTLNTTQRAATPFLWVSLVAAAFAMSACKPDLIPGTNIEDTDDNRKIFDFLGKYRDAVVQKNPDAVVALCAPEYFEDGGTVATTDDYSLSQLKDRLVTDFAKSKEIHLDILVQQIIPPKGNEDEAKRLYKVSYHYNARALVSLPAGDKWITVSDVNQVVLRPTDSDYLIVSGL